MKLSTTELEKYMKGAVITDSLLDKLTEAILNDNKYVNVTQKEYNELMERQKNYELKDTEWKELVKLKALAKELEKEGNLSGAKKMYETLIRYAVQSKSLRYPANYGHDVNRYRIVCNKLKLKDDYLNLVTELGIPIHLYK